MGSSLEGQGIVDEGSDAEDVTRVDADDDETIAFDRSALAAHDAEDPTMIRMVFEDLALERPIPLVRRVSRTTPTLDDESFPAVSLAADPSEGAATRRSSPAFEELEARSLTSVRPVAVSVPAPAAPPFRRARHAALALMIGAAAFSGLAGGKWLADRKTPLSTPAPLSLAKEPTPATPAPPHVEAPAEDTVETPLVVETTIEAAIAVGSPRVAVIAKDPAKPAETTDKPATEAPTPETLDEDQPQIQPPFDAAAASSSLSSIAPSLSSCAKDDDPVGSASVAVTFAASGRVTVAVVEGSPFAGTSSGGCIASKLRAARVPAFSGPAVTVRKTFTIRLAPFANAMVWGRGPKLGVRTIRACPVVRGGEAPCDR